MSEQRTAIRCMVCGGDHEPNPAVCNSDGMDREIERLGSRRWNRIAAQAQTCKRRKDGADWICDRCGSLWSDMLHGLGWLPLSCPNRSKKYCQDWGITHPLPHPPRKPEHPNPQQAHRIHARVCKRK